MSKCYRCFRPEKSCYCKYINPFDCGIKFVILMHPKEAFKQKTGTGRLTHIALIDSEIIIGIDFTENKRLLELLSDEQYYPVLLYPDEKAWTASNPALKTQLGENKKLLVIVSLHNKFCFVRIKIIFMPQTFKLTVWFVYILRISGNKVNLTYQITCARILS